MNKILDILNVDLAEVVMRNYEYLGIGLVDFDSKNNFENSLKFHHHFSKTSLFVI
jgi:hypothetical protein